MSFHFRHLTLLALAASLLAGCRKNEVDSLEGPLPTPAFTVRLDTTQFPVVATFTNTTKDGFLYQWDFGDGSALEPGLNATHAYTLPRSYPVRLVVAGRGGTATYPQDVIIPSLCGNPGFSVLTGCGSASWTYTDQPGAIVKLAADGVTVVSSSPAPLPECQEDDQFTFTNTFTYTYDGGLTCGLDYNGASDFTYRKVGRLGQLTLKRHSAFIGLTDTTQSLTYDIVEAVPGRLRIRSTNADGTHTVVTLVPPLPPLQRAERLLTGGSSRIWVFDNSKAAAIVVGTNAAPASYYPGGLAGTLPACQTDDEYTFTAARVMTYDSKGGTMTAGGAACGPSLSGTTAYTFDAAPGAVARLTLARPDAFIGTVDAAPTPNQFYRILSINSREMVVRSGSSASPVIFTFKMRVK